MTVYQFKRSSKPKSSYPYGGKKQNLLRENKAVIRKCITKGMSMAELSKKFGVDRTTMSKFVRESGMATSSDHYKVNTFLSNDLWRLAIYGVKL